MENNINQYFNKGVIYKITSPTGSIYIGQSSKILARLNRYKSHDCIGQPKLYNSLEKYGFNTHSFDIIDSCNIHCKNLLNILEFYWIKEYDSKNNGLNCTDGGDCTGRDCKITTRIKISNANMGKTAWNKGVAFSEEVKSRMSESAKGKTLSNETKKKMSEIRKGRKGKPVSNEAKIKMSVAKKGKKLTEEHKLNMSISRKGRTSPMKGKPCKTRKPLMIDGVMYTSIKEAHLKLGINASTINRRCCSKKIKFENYKFI